MIGIMARCIIIPGIDFKITPVINAEKIKELPPSSVNISVVIARKALPISIADISEQYIKGFFWGRRLFIIAVIAPYAASSNAIDNAMGYSTGKPKRNERRIGDIKPTVTPHFHPQIYPQRNIGMCIGQNIEFISGFCPPIKGSNSANAKKSAENIIFCIALFCLMFIAPFDVIFIFLLTKL